MIKRIFGLLVLALLVVPATLHAQTSTAMRSPSIAQPIAQRQPVLCSISGAVRYPQYNVVKGYWECVPLKVTTNLVTGIGQNISANAIALTIPNTTISAIVHVRVFLSLGAGGSIGANECSATLEGNVVIARTAGVLGVVTASSATMTASSCVSGAESLTLSYAVSSVAGGTTGTNTAYITVKVLATGSALNSQAVVRAELENNVNAGALVTMQ